MLGVFIAVISIFQVITSIRYEQAIPLPEEETDAIALLVVCLSIHCVMTIVFGLGVYLFGEGFILWANTKALEKYIYLLPIGLFPVGVYEILSYWTIRTKEFQILAKTKIRQGLAMVATQIGFGFTPFGNLGLVLGEIVGRCAGIWTLARPLWQHKKTAIFCVNFIDIKINNFDSI